MALRGAVATACNVGGRHRNPSLLSVPHYLKLKYHYPPSHALHRFTAFPIYQPGGESLSLFSIFIFQSLLGSFGLYRNNKNKFSLKTKFGFHFLWCFNVFPKENMTLDMIEWQKRTYVTDPY